MLLALAAFGGALVAWFYSGPAGTPQLDAKTAIARSTAALRAHDATSARDFAVAAVRDEPSLATAHLALAKAMLALGDAVGAEAEIQRARDTGADPKLLPHLRAHALLLQGQAQKALVEADNAAPAYRAYALRIRARALAAGGNWQAAENAFGEAARLTPADPDLWSDQGRFRLATGDMLGANEAAQRVLQLDPDHLDGLVLRAELVRAQFGLVAALPWFEAALKRDPRSLGALVEYAATLGEAGRTVDALAATRRALAAQPNSPQALYLQSVIAARAGNLALAHTLLAKTGNTIDTLPGTMLLKGALDLQSGEYEQATTRLKGLVDRQPLNIPARKLLAAAMLRRDSADAASELLRPLTGLSGVDSYALLLAARGLERTGNRDGAAALIDRSIAPASSATRAFILDDSLETLSAQADQRPGDPAAQVALLRGLYAVGDNANALARAQQIASANPGVPSAQLLLGDALMLAGRQNDALASYRQAAGLRFDAATMSRLVETLGAVGKNQEATNVLGLFLSQNPMSVTALRLSARSQLRAGEYEAAINSLEQVRSQLGDGDAVLNAELALAYAGAGASDEAQELGEAAYALAPANPLVVEAFGWVLYQAGDLAHAAELTRKGLRLVPEAPDLRWQLAQIYADAGNKDQALLLIQGLLADSRFTRRTEAAELLPRLR
jgi:tetratricopeptide (TPR) repeat protein